MFERILVVCIGNVCRSPVGEALLRRQFPAKQVSSAGLGALVGYGVESSARQLAEAEGLDVSGHQARQLTVEMLQQHDLILVMSDGQRLAVGEMLPAAMGKTMLFGRWLGDDKDIPDPYRKSPEVFQHVHDKLVAAAHGWAGKL